MKLSHGSYLLSLFLSSIVLLGGSCGKGGGGGGTPPNPCSGVTVTVTATTTNPSAPGATNGSIDASASGGSGFTFSINGGAFQASGTFSNLAAGTYSVSAKNSNGCTGAGTFTLTAPNPCAGVTITVSGTPVNPTAPGATNGSITANATGGTGPYTFSKDGLNFQATGVFNTLGAGNYTITAKDANGCTGAANFTLTAPNPCAGVTIIVAGTFTNPTAPAATNGSISANANGGTGPYTFSRDGVNFQATGTFNNLGAGTYTITAKDANNCTGTTQFTLVDPNPCAGVTVTATISTTGNTPCAGSPTGSFTATPSGGLAPYTFSRNGGAFQPSGTFNNLPAGGNTLVVKDANGCLSTTINVNIINLPQGPLFSAVKTLLQNNCVTCHNPGNQNGGMDWTVDCNIVNFKINIQNRAVNGNPSPMPPTGLLPASERQKIVDWINAGGKFTD
ncbi:MAG TPA: hypothetical protein VMZ03_12730 [Chitinophagaceae bacterium]|nr:hypothetical protein [Chitinophagaceae bacterium]